MQITFCRFLSSYQYFTLLWKLNWLQMFKIKLSSNQFYPLGNIGLDMEIWESTWKHVKKVGDMKTQLDCCKVSCISQRFEVDYCQFSDFVNSIFFTCDKNRQFASECLREFWNFPLARTIVLCLNANSAYVYYQYDNVREYLQVVKYDNLKQNYGFISVAET